ncbi:MAG: glycogen debranching enzyme GlgX [Marinilabiliales bacterium]|nr:MAG: glycogen debranching enzyme GlgX [Marinilabiliales bacterium]
MDKTETWPGRPYPLGARYDGKGVNFALFAENAWGVELCLYDNDGAETNRIKVVERTHNSWHVYIPGLRPGQQYGYRVHGPYEPEKGLRFNPNKLLIDPYAKALNGTGKWNNALFGYEIGHEKGDLSFSKTDSAPYVPKCVVIDDHFDWEGDTLLKIPLNKTVIYELHVKGFTRLHKAIPEELRGTYAGLAHPETISYLQKLGVNAVELMPVHQFVNDRHLIDNNLTNYWGYNSINFFAPHPAYSASGGGGQEQVSEFKDMVRELHKAGIEVIIDVVYNHTGEGNHLGPTISFRGIDNMSYYRLMEDDRRHYMDYTGTGNTLNTVHPTILRLIMDSLRYWVTEMHVDGFRFDLATALAREFSDVDKWGSFFDVLHQDPVLSQVKLIAEPWDIGENGYQVGNFPAGWLEWNGRYRDSMREFWRGENEMLPEFANRITGSSDLYFDDWRRPVASINFITAHDGFTLRDLVSYNNKHNDANKEESKDGEDHNRSWNCGVEGETGDEKIISLRKKQVRNFLATLFLSQGIPMLLAGDEMWRTQKGNNNAYCQDNEISWVDWDQTDGQMVKFVSGLIRLRLEHPVFCRTRWFRSEPVNGARVKDIEWFLPEGNTMSLEHWNTSFAKSIGVFLSGEGIISRDPRGNRIVDDSFYLMFNAHDDTVIFRLPTEEYGNSWQKVIDTHDCFVSEEGGPEYGSGNEIYLDGRSVVLLMCKKK